MLLRLLGTSWRVEWDGLERLAAARAGSPHGNVIYAFWHSSLLVLAWTHRARNVQVLVSRHRDGELIARILAGLGYGLVRGSSRRGGVEALFRMATCLEAGADVAVTVDGPIGPRHRVHPGVVLLARRTGCPIVPILTTARRDWRLHTWDRLSVPQPGSVVRIQHGEPLWLAPAAAGVLPQQHELEQRLRDWTLDEAARWGRGVDFDDVQDERSYWERASEAPRPPRALRVLARAHGAGLAVERRLRPRRSGDGGRPWVIGIGNLEAGGTGKTPCVLLLATALGDAGLAVAVLTRGHGGDLGSRPERLEAVQWARASDEARLLAQGLGDRVPVVVSRDKRAGLAWLRRQLDVDVVLVDDALQTPGLPVDRHLVLLDWERPLGNGWLLPAGRLREPPAALGRAAALLFTRCAGAGLPQHPAWSGLAAAGRVFTAAEEFAALRTLQGSGREAEGLRGQGVALASGLGRPQAFERLARRLGAEHGFDVRRCVRVGDHAPIEAALRKLLGRLEGLGCSRVLITRKDALRLGPDPEWDEPLLVLEQRLVVGDLARLVAVLLSAAHSSAKLANSTRTEA